jgi:hypothetical protein
VLFRSRPPHGRPVRFRALTVRFRLYGRWLVEPDAADDRQPRLTTVSPA